MTTKSKLILATVIWLLSDIAQISETWYFGWNLFPVSTAELVIDIVLAIIHFVSFIMALRYLVCYAYDKGVTDTFDAITKLNPFNPNDN